MDSRAEVTALLLEWRHGDRRAFDRLVPLLYAELRRVAAAHLRSERSDHTLQPTALVHEAYLRLVGDTAPALESRAHFLAVAARVMRRILIEHARKRCAARRGGGAACPQLEEAGDTAGLSLEDLLALDEALDRLAAVDPRKAQAVELRYFGGLTAEETAQVLGISAVTVTRDLRFAGAWLRRELAGT